MTLCIAAACKHEDEPRIVLCSDWQQQVEGLGASETKDKLSWVKEGWPTLISDTMCHAEELVGVYSQHLKKANITAENVIDEMKVPAQQYKAILANDYIQQLLGVDYNYFLQYGKERFPDEFFREKMGDISRIKLGASLIIAGFVQGNDFKYGKGLRPCLFVVEDSEEHRDTVRLETDYAAIGSGAYVASASLYYREQQSGNDLMHTIYSVYAAMKFAVSARVPGVGELYSIDVLAPTFISVLTSDGYARCRELHRKFGPRIIKRTHDKDFEMKADFVYERGKKGTMEWER